MHNYMSTRNGNQKFKAKDLSTFFGENTFLKKI